MDWADIAANPLEGIMTDHKCFTAEFQAFVKEFPELILIALGNDANLGQVDGNNPLIEAASNL